MSASPTPLERAAARNLVKNYLRVRPGENVIVEAWSHTLSMSSALVDEVRRVGASAFLAYENDDAWWRAVDRKQAGPLGSLSAPEWAALKAADVYIQFWGPADSARLAKLPEKRFEPWADGWFDKWYKIAQSTGLRGGRMGTGWVTDTRAQKWGVRKQRWMNQVLEGCLADPEEMAKSGKRLVRALAGEKKVRITHPNGTDLEVGLSGIRPRIYNGYPHPKDKAYSQYDMMANFPDGTVRFALDSKTAEGKITSPSRSYEMVWFPWTTYSGGTFEFSSGKLTSFSFLEGGKEFAKRYARGKAGKDRTGFLGIGLNPLIKNVPYHEDNERGCVQVTVGGNAYLGGHNPSDFVGWICLPGAEVSAGGSPVVRSGKIL